MANLVDISCNDVGEIDIIDIINKINEIIAECANMKVCCDTLMARSHLLTLREGNTLYITDNGTPPKGP